MREKAPGMLQAAPAIAQDETAKQQRWKDENLNGGMTH